METIQTDDAMDLINLDGTRQLVVKESIPTRNKTAASYHLRRNVEEGRKARQNSRRAYNRSGQSPPELEPRFHFSGQCPPELEPRFHFSGQSPPELEPKFHFSGQCPPELEPRFQGRRLTSAHRSAR